MKRLIKSTTLAAALVCTLSANAAIDLGAIELGKVYEIPDFQSVTGTITAPSTGTLLQNGVSDLQVGDLEQTFVGYGDYGIVYSYQVTEGTTYPVEAGFVMSGGKVCWTMQGDQALELTEATPAEGSYLSPRTNYSGQLLLRFNAAVNCSGATATIGDWKGELSVTGDGSVTLVADVKQMYNTARDAGAISDAGGEKITLTFSGVATTDGDLYAGTGEITLSYLAAPKAASLVSTTCSNGNTLKSYYAPGDPEALLSFTFDAPLANDGLIMMSIAAGNPEGENTYYYEEIAPVIDGATATVDLAGNLRDLTPYIGNAGAVGIKLFNVRDAQGNIAEGDGDTSYGSYNYTLRYSYIEPVTITSEFNPANGASLHGVNEIEIWFNNADKVTFDGVLFSCADAEAVVPLDQITIVREANDITMNVPVPEAVKGHKGVTVTLNNLVSLDGYDHNRQIMAMYDAWTVTLAAPIQDGGSYLTTGEDDFVFTLNEAYGYMRYDLYNGEEWVYGSWLNAQEDGTYTAYNGNWPLYKDTDNRMTLSAYANEGEYWAGAEPAATATLHFTGLTSGFSYSDVKFVGIDPEPNSQITPTDDFCFTITFDGLVNIGAGTCVNLGFGASNDFAQIIAVDPEQMSGLSNTWKLYPQASDLAGNGIDISVYAYDIEGRLVEGNMGGGANDFLQFSYTVRNESNLRTLTLSPADGASVDQIACITVSYPGDAVGINFSYTGEMPTIQNKVRDIVYTFTADDLMVDSDIIGYDELNYPIYDENTWVTMTLAEPITAEGSYTLTIPEGFFTIGAQFLTYDNETTVATYHIDGGGTDPEPVDGTPLTLNPAPGTVNEISRIDITADGIEDAVATDGDITLTNAAGDVLYSIDAFTFGDSAFDWDTWSFLGYTIVLDQPITEDGVYTLTIPAGFFEFMDMSKSAPVTAVYVIDSTTGVHTIIVGTADRYEVYNLQGHKVLSTASAADLATLRAGIYIINGVKVLIK